MCAMVSNLLHVAAFFISKFYGKTEAHKYVFISLSNRMAKF